MIKHPVSLNHGSGYTAVAGVLANNEGLLILGERVYIELVHQAEDGREHKGIVYINMTDEGVIFDLWQGDGQGDECAATMGATWEEINGDQGDDSADDHLC